MAREQALLVRADANTHLGAGHVVRCLALAQAWQEAGGSVIFLTAVGAPALEERLKSEAMEIVAVTAQPGSAADAIQTVHLARDMDASWIVVDGYQFGSDYQRIIKDARVHLLSVDDYGHSERYYSDIVLNQNLHAREGLYVNREPHTRLLLGPRHVLLRREFLTRKRTAQSDLNTSWTILISLGGFAPDNLTARLVQALQQTNIDGGEIVVVTGYHDLNHRSLWQVGRTQRIVTRVVANTNMMAQWMQRATLAISAAGSTSWELAYSGTPGILIVRSSNQIPVARELHATGAFINAGQAASVDFQKLAALTEELISDSFRLREMSERARQIVDGSGANRVLMHMTGNQMFLRPARETDCRLFWQWANDPVTRESSLSTQQISLMEHIKWFDEKLQDRRYFMYVACDSLDRPLGQSRFHMRNPAEAEISIALDPMERGKGYGAILIDLSVKKIFRLTPARAVHAYIKPDNRASIKAFEKAMFRYVSRENVRGSDVFHFVRLKNHE